MPNVYLTPKEERKYQLLTGDKKLEYLEKRGQNRDLRLLAKNKGDWEGYIALHDKQDIMQAFQEVLQVQLTDKEYWHLLGFAWRLFPDRKHPWARLWFGSSRSNRLDLMSPEEHKLLGCLPDNISVYSSFGISCRLSKGIPNGTHVVQKARVVALFDRGLYFELIVL